MKKYSLTFWYNGWAETFGQMSKAHLAKHFQLENIPCATIYQIIKHFEDGLTCENKTKKGCPMN